MIERFQRKPGGTEKLLKWKDDYHNESLSDLLKNTNEQKQIEEAGFRLIQRFQPVFMEGRNGSFIRAPFFASRKVVFGKKMETFPVNLMVIWMMTVVLAFALHFDILKKLINAGERFRKKR